MATVTVTVTLPTASYQATAAVCSLALMHCLRSLMKASVSSDTLSERHYEAWQNCKTHMPQRCSAWQHISCSESHQQCRMLQQAVQQGSRAQQMTAAHKPSVEATQVLGALGSAEQAMSNVPNPGGGSAAPLQPSEAQPSASETLGSSGPAPPGPESLPHLQYGPLYPQNGMVAASRSWKPFASTGLRCSMLLLDIGEKACQAALASLVSCSCFLLESFILQTQAGQEP